MASKALKDWNRQAREVARPGQCCAIGCKALVPKGKAWCAEHAGDAWIEEAKLAPEDEQAKCAQCGAVVGYVGGPVEFTCPAGHCQV